MTPHKTTSHKLGRALRTTLRIALALTLAALLATSASAQTLTTLYTFASAPDGQYPNGGLVLDASGNLYGTTWLGGTSTLCQNGCGTVFKLTPSGTETILHSFTKNHKKVIDGTNPNGSLILDSQGNLYGTTYYGGTANKGTVYKLTSSGSETLLYSFKRRQYVDGRYPNSGLVMDPQGNLYGTTYKGADGIGSVFKLTPSGVETVLYGFTRGIQDGRYPVGVVLDAQGNLYGTAINGAGAGFHAQCVNVGCGMAYQISPTGGETILWHFGDSQTDGVYPSGPLVWDAQGNLYGTTRGGSSGDGTVFKLSPSTHTETVVCDFTGANGAGPSDVIFDAQGNLYGVTISGGAFSHGTIFKISPSGTETVVYSFAGGADGYQPQGPLAIDAQGNLYGITNGGANGLGTVFKLTPQ